MNYHINPMPGQVKEDWQLYDLESCITEVRNLRHFVGSLFMQVKEWTGRMNDLQQTSEQIVALKADRDAAYISLSNKTNELDENITLIMQALGLDEEETTDAD